MRVLLIDDSRAMRRILMRVLAEPGDARFVEAAGAADALEALSAAAEGRAMPPDLVVVDWNMLGTDALTLIRQIRAQEPAATVILVTTEACKGHVPEALRAGATDYLVKPFAAEALLRKSVQSPVRRQRAA